MKQFFGSFLAISALFLISCSEDIDAPLTSGQVPSLFETAAEARILTSDINTSNGILHLLDKLLLPQEVQNLFLNEGL